MSAMGTVVNETGAGRLLLCFDFEGSYGMPYAAPYNLEESATRITTQLADYDARAVFFVVGQMVEQHPEVIDAIASAGHEIGLHGYRHDDLGSYDSDQLAKFDTDLLRVESLVEGITGSRPRCFRAPYLLGPHFYRAEIYALLRAHGYRWVSNREIRYPVELLRPGRSPLNRAWRLGWRDGDPALFHSRVGLAALNAGLLVKESFGGSLSGRLHWLVNSHPPFLRDGMLEVPLYAPLDCDLVCLPAPQEDTPPEMLSYASAVLRSAVTAPGPLTMVTFHDWIVGSANRLSLLGDVLAAATKNGMSFCESPER
jgi:hypothetical protein